MMKNMILKLKNNNGFMKTKEQLKRKMICLCVALHEVVISNANLVYAAKSKKEEADISEVTNGIDVLKDIVLACVSGVGVIFLAWGLLDFGTAYSAHDTTQQSASIKKVIGGLIMIAVPSILKVLGAT